MTLNTLPLHFSISMTNFRFSFVLIQIFLPSDLTNLSLSPSSSPLNPIWSPSESSFMSVSYIGLSCFSGTLRRDDSEDGRDCWKLSDGNNFKVRSKNFVSDKSKVQAGKPLMDLVAVDWLKDTKRMDHVARRNGCAVQVPGSTWYSLVFYFVIKTLEPGSLLQRFFDGDDEFRNSRFKLIPSVPKGSWIVRQSVGNSACLLAKAVDCTFIRGPKYLEIDVDVGSSTVANGVLGLVLGVVTSLVVDLAFLVQGNTPDELLEQIIGAVRLSHVELSFAVVPVFDANPSSE